MQIKKYFVLISAVLLCAAENAGAQYNPYWQWAKADTPYAYAVANASSVLAVKGGKALWGRMTAIKRSTPAGEPQGNYIVTEHDSTGRELNRTLMNGKVQLIDAHADAAGNWYVLGKFYDTLLFSGGQRMVRNNPATNVDADHFMAKFNAGSMALAWLVPVGPFRWVSAQAFTVTNSQIYIAVDSLDNTIVRGMNFSTGNATHIFRQRGTSTTTSIQVDAQNNIYLAGSCSMEGIDFNGATEPSTLPNPYSYIAKYRSNGTHIWHRWMADRTCNQRKLTLHQNRFLYYTGSLLDSFTIGGKFMHRAYNGLDFIAARLDTNGTVVWARQMDSTGGGRAHLGEQPYHAVVTPDTALVLFANGSGYIFWGDTFQTDLTGVSAATLVSIGADNKPRWIRPLYTNYTVNQHIATEDLSVWVTGNALSTSGTVQMDTLRLRVAGGGRFTPFLAKAKLVRPIPVNPPAGITGAPADDLSVYPVPVRTTLRVAGLQGACDLWLSDISGRTVRSLRTEPGTGEALIDVADLPRGAYVLTMQGTEMRAVRKILLQ